MKVILATDGSDASHDAEWLLLRIPFPEPTQLLIANVTLVPSLAHLRREIPASVNEMLEEYQARAESLLAEEASRFQGMSGTVETCQRSGHPADQLVQLACDWEADLIVIGARGHSRSQRFLLGSVSLKVAMHAPCSVLVTRPSKEARSSEQPFRILICHDGSESSKQAVKMLSHIHWGENVEVTILWVVTVAIHLGTESYQKTQPLREEEQREAEESLAWAVGQFRSSTLHVRSELREAESAAGEIVESADRIGADLVVMGHHGRSGIERFFLGSASESVLRHALCSVWVVRQPSAD